jgi:hypothetical protein
MQLLGEDLCFYYEKEMINPFLKICWKKIICVNKRQIDRHDLHTFSIHYFNSSNKASEIRLKCISRSEVDEWLRKFNKTAPHKIEKHKFTKHNNEYKYHEIIKQPYMLKPKEYYMKMHKGSVLIYISLKKFFFIQLRRLYAPHSIRGREEHKSKDKPIASKDINIIIVNDKSSEDSEHHNENQPLVTNANNDVVSSVMIDIADIDFVVEKIGPIVMLY